MKKNYTKPDFKLITTNNSICKSSNGNHHGWDNPKNPHSDEEDL